MKFKGHIVHDVYKILSKHIRCRFEAAVTMRTWKASDVIVSRLMDAKLRRCTTKGLAHRAGIHPHIRKREAMLLHFMAFQTHNIAKHFIADIAARSWIVVVP